MRSILSAFQLSSHRRHHCCYWLVHGLVALTCVAACVILVSAVAIASELVHLYHEARSDAEPHAHLTLAACRRMVCDGARDRFAVTDCEERVDHTPLDLHSHAVSAAAQRFNGTTLGLSHDLLIQVTDFAVRRAVALCLVGLGMLVTLVLVLLLYRPFRYVAVAIQAKQTRRKERELERVCQPVEIPPQATEILGTEQHQPPLYDSGAFFDAVTLEGLRHRLSPCQEPDPYHISSGF